MLPQKPEKLNHTLEESPFPAKPVKEAIDGQVKDAAMALNTFVWDAMNRGVGKGAAIAALGTVAFCGAMGAAMGLVGGIPVEVMPLAEQSFSSGLAAGLINGATSVVFSFPGLLVMGIGAALGAAHDLQQQQNETKIEVAGIQTALRKAAKEPEIDIKQDIMIEKLSEWQREQAAKSKPETPPRGETEAVAPQDEMVSKLSEWQSSQAKENKRQPEAEKEETKKKQADFGNHVATANTPTDKEVADTLAFLDRLHEERKAVANQGWVRT